jgi:Uncharacterized conserved protein
MGIFIIDEFGNGFRFLLMAGNGRVIGTSGVYNNKVAAMVGMEMVKKVIDVAGVEDETIPGFKSMANPKFVIKPDAYGRIRWNLQSFDGQAVLSSQSYLGIKNAKKGILSVQKNGPIGTLEDLPFLAEGKSSEKYAKSLKS